MPIRRITALCAVTTVSTLALTSCSDGPEIPATNSPSTVKTPAVADEEEYSSSPEVRRRQENYAELTFVAPGEMIAGEAAVPDSPHEDHRRSPAPEVYTSVDETVTEIDLSEKFTASSVTCFNGRFVFDSSMVYDVTRYVEYRDRTNGRGPDTPAYRTPVGPLVQNFDATTFSSDTDEAWTDTRLIPGDSPVKDRWGVEELLKMIVVGRTVTAPSIMAGTPQPVRTEDGRPAIESFDNENLPVPGYLGLTVTSADDLRRAGELYQAGTMIKEARPVREGDTYFIPVATCFDSRLFGDIGPGQEFAVKGTEPHVTKENRADPSFTQEKPAWRVRLGG